MRLKSLILLLTAFAFISCPSPSTPDNTHGGGTETETGKKELSDITTGQNEMGAVVVTWTDPDSNQFAEVGVSYANKSNPENKSSETKVKKGVQKFSIVGLTLGETYTFFLEPYSVEGKMLDVPQTIEHTVTSINCILKKSDFRDLYAEFEWSITGNGNYDSVEITVESQKEENTVAPITVTVQKDETAKRINLRPGVEYNYSVNVKNGSEIVARIKGTGTTLLFWDDFNETGTSNGPNASRWSNPGPAGSAWNNALVKDWSMVEFKADDDGTTYIRFNGTKENDLAKGSAVHSKGLFYFTYGKIEFRARLTSNKAQGAFPALWLMPEKSGHPQGDTWPVGGELDVMEHVKQKDYVHQTVHTKTTSNPGNGYAGKTSMSKPVNGKGWDQWHTFAMEWTKQGIAFYLDDILQPSASYSYVDNIDAYPFTEESAFYIIMNMGVGRSSDGFPGGAENGFKAHIDVDYVKVTSNKDTIVQDCLYYQSENSK